MHELAHVSLHLADAEARFYDNLDVEPYDDDVEREADELAGEALIPSEAWRKSPASRLRRPKRRRVWRGSWGFILPSSPGECDISSSRTSVSATWSALVRYGQCFPEVEWQ